MWATFFILLHFLVSLTVTIRVLLRPRLAPSTRLAWIMVIEAVPYLGILIYIAFGEVRMRRAEVQKMADIRAYLMGVWKPSPDALSDPPEFAQPVIAANQAIGGMVPVRGNRVVLLPEDDGAMTDMIKHIDEARDHVHVLFYIWLDDLTGRAVAEAIIRAAKRGVACRVIVDALGSRGFMHSSSWSEMRDAGVTQTAALPYGNPLLRMLFQRIDLRNHRKIVVIDNCFAYTGSRNCSDMAFAVKAKYGPWIDVFFRIEGPVLRQLHSVFLADWMTYTGEDLGHMLTVPLAVNGPGVMAQTVATGPDQRHGNIADTLITMLHAARDEVIITTPYYVPDQPLDAAIRSCAIRGVKVTLILPERNDSLIVGATSEGFYYDLLRAGVQIRLYQNGLPHAKILTTDGQMALIGSANLDRRSFELNYEVNTLLIDPGIVGDIDARQQSYIERSRAITLAEVSGWRSWRRMRNNLLALAAPLL